MPLRLIPAIHRATHQVGLFLERSAELGVTQAEAHILAHLSAEGDCTVGELHRALAHKRSTLTSILDRLVERGLVTREVAEHDRRAFIVRLSRTGKALAARVYALLESLERDAIGGTRAAAVAETLRLIGALEGAAGESSERPQRARRG